MPAYTKVKSINKVRPGKTAATMSVNVLTPARANTNALRGMYVQSNLCMTLSPLGRAIGPFNPICRKIFKNVNLFYHILEIAMLS